MSKIRATNISNSPGVYTGFVDELQKSYPQWYSQVYSEANPLWVALPTCTWL